MATGLTAAHVVDELRRRQSDAELAKVRKRLAPDEEAFGMRMGDLFGVAKAHTDLDLSEVDRLLNHPAYEPRMAAMCILDFKARRRIHDDEREQLYQLYLRRHDRITTWDMVDRSAPRVVGSHLAGRSPTLLHELAGAREPLKRRTATTAWRSRSWSRPIAPATCRERSTTLTSVPGVIAILIVLLMIPVLVLMSGGVLSAILGFVLGRDVDARHQGSELLELDD